MNKILFSHSYFMRFDPKQWATGQPYPPLATIGAAALLLEHQYQVSLFDTMFAEGPEEVESRLDAQRPDFFVLYDDGFNYLTKMCLTNMREAAYRMIALARAKGCIVIASSSDSTDHYREYLEQGCHYVLLGEGEQTLLELVDALRAGNVGPVAEAHAGGAENVQVDVTGIAGLAWLTKEGVQRTAGRPVMRDLDALPLAAWDLVNIAAYRSVWLKHHGYFSLNIATTRGCPFKCNWCAKPIYGNRYHARTPAHVVKELKWLQEHYGFDHVWFCDDIFGLKPGWVQEFAQLVREEGLQFRFKIQSRADLLLQENYVKALAQAGCENVWMGAESGSQKILDAMDKGITVTQVGEATLSLRHHGIRPSFFIQFGYPGERMEDIQLTIKMIHELLPDSIGISVSYPLPGTVFHERVKADLKEKTNWTDSDELKLMFRNTYPPAFYKQLHRYVHKTYRRQLAMDQLRGLVERRVAITAVRIRRAASLIWYAPAALFSKWKLDRLAQAGENFSKG